MADLLKELRLLKSNGWGSRREHPITGDSACAGPSAAASLPQPELKQQDVSQSSGETAHAAPGLPYTVSSVLNSSGAVAAYRRQYLDLGCMSAGSSAVTEAAGQPKSVFTLKSRPQGKLSTDAGLPFPPGYLPRPSPVDIKQQPDMTNLPAKPGVGNCLPPARMQPRSCCPPPYPEPLVEIDPAVATAVTEHQAQRGLNPDSLINRLVYDSLVPPSTADQDSESGSGFRASSCCSSKPSSCRTTRTTGSAQSSRRNSATSDAAAANVAPSNWQCSGEESVGSARADWHHYAPELNSWYTLQGPNDHTLVFESRFECGNLRRAIQVHPYEYDLILQPDINTHGHTQWYYFAVANTRPGQAYRFNIINFMKEDSLYNMGMLPLVHSERQMQEKGIGWFRSGSKVFYGPNNINRKKQVYHTLTFVMQFPYDDDWVHLAHCYPYSYTDLQHHLHAIVQGPNPGFLVERSCLATTLAGNAVDVLTITAAPQDGMPLNQRKGIVLSARVHPGESNASWMMKGAVQQLLGTSEESRRLRENFVFKVVPMLNPDGVIVGNYRCSLAGLDLNRVWQEPDTRIQPVIAAYKNMIKSFMAEREVAMFCDLHGHSLKHGIFMYGCTKKAGKDSISQAAGWPVPGTIGGLPGIPTKCQSNIFPLMLYINAPDLFSYKSCSFKVQKSKAGTGRVVGFRELGLVNAFTMEASFSGATVGRFAGQHFNTGHLEDMGSALVRTLLDYWAPSESNSAADLAAQLTGSGRSNTATAGPGQPALGLLFDLGAATEDEDSCTDSDDESSDDELPAASTSAVHEKCTTADTSVNDSAAAAARISSSMAQTSAQLVAMLSMATGLTSINRDPASSDHAATSTVAAAAHLLTALEKSSMATLASSTNCTGHTKAGSAVSCSTGCSHNSSNGSSEQQKQVALQPVNLLASTTAAADAARKLLDRLTAARAEVQHSATTAMPIVSSSIVCQSAAPGMSNSNASCRPGLGGAMTTDIILSQLSSSSSQAGVVHKLESTLGDTQIGCNNAVADASQQQQQQLPQLAQEDARLADTPGLINLLQQLVDDQKALSAAVATACSKPKAKKGGKKKGRRRPFARYGNPEVLRAARAKADATLAAALPELGHACSDDDDDDDAEEEGEHEDDMAVEQSAILQSSNQPTGALFAPVPAHFNGNCDSSAVRLIAAGRRAHTARAVNRSALDAARYIALLDKEKRHTGGVLAYSVVDNHCLWGQGSASCNKTSSKGEVLPPYGDVDNDATHKEHCSTNCAEATTGVTRSRSWSKISVAAPDVDTSRGATKAQPISLLHITAAAAGGAEAITNGSSCLGRRRQSKSAA